MGRNLVARFILQLQDRTAAGLNALQRRLQGLAQVARRVALVGAGIAGLSVAGPVREAAAAERGLRQMAITAGLSGAAVEEMIRKSRELFQTVARETNVRARELQDAAGVLLAGGGEAGKVWESLVPILGRASAASGAAATDLAQTALAMVNNLKLTPAQVEQAFAALIIAGKEGQFELRDMAREFPQLTAAAAGLGLVGPRAVHSIAAALQVARQGAGSAGQAANNLAEIFSKMTSPDAVRGFRDMGVDIEKVLADAAAKGINPFEAVIQKIREITGNNMFRVSELFGDKQALDFLRPMLQQVERYIDVRDAAARAEPGAIARDMETALRGLDAELRRITVLWDEWTTRVGDTAERWLPHVTVALRAMWTELDALDKAFPGVVDGGAALMFGLVVLSGALGMIGLVAPAAAAGFAAVKAAVLTLLSPIALLVVATVLALRHIWKEWARFRGFFQQMADGLKQIGRGLSEFVAGELSGDMSRSLEGLKQVFGGLGTYLLGLRATLQTLLSDFTTWVDGWSGGALTRSVEGIKAAFRPLTEWFKGLWDGMKTTLSDFLDWVTNAVEGAQNAWNQIQGRFAAGRAAQGGPVLAPGEGSRNFGARGGLPGFPTPAELAGAGVPRPASPATQHWNGQLSIGLAPGLELRRTESSGSSMAITTDRGPVRNRP